MDTIKIINYIIMVVFFVCYAYQFAYIPLALLKKQKPMPDGELHRLAVLIAARNEEAVIGNLIDSLRRQSYPLGADGHLCRGGQLHRPDRRGCTYARHQGDPPL